MKKIELTIIYVNYKSSSQLLKSLESVKKCSNLKNSEIIVVNNDNGKSLKEKISKYKDISIIRSGKNLGYGGGNNLGSEHAKGKYLLFLNPDTEITKGSIDVMYNFLKKRKDAGIVAPTLINEKGKLIFQIGSRQLTPMRAVFALSFINKIWPSNPISTNYFLKDEKTSLLKEVDAVPGSAFMIRKEVFDNAGRFDENFFMYFEESDLGKRVRELGYKIFITTKSKVVHKWHVNTKDKALKEYFEKSRFYYFRKHFGIIKALEVELFCRISKYNIAFILIFALGIFIRFYNINHIFYLDSEVADNLLDIKNHILNRTIPLIGPPTSHTWLYFSPLFYWIYAPVLVISNYDPMSYTFFGLIISCIVILTNYIFVKKYWGSKEALVSSFIISTSKYLIDSSYLSRFYTYTVFLTYIFFIFLFNFLKRDNKSFFWMFFVLSVSFSFHYTPIVLIPPMIVLLYIKKKYLGKKEIRNAFLGFIIPLIPIFLYDIKHHFRMTINLLLWLPYRILTILRVVHLKETSQYPIMTGLRQFYLFISYLFSLNQFAILSVAASVFILVLIFFYFKKYKLKKTYSNIIFFFTISSTFLLVLHGDTPMHYFLIVSPLFIIIFSFVTTAFMSNAAIKIIFAGYLILNIVNAGTILKGKNELFEYLFSGKNGLISYDLQNKITDFVIHDSKGKPYSLKRIGVNDAYGGNFAQNYEYLMWKSGNEPVMIGDFVITSKIPSIEYTIVEKQNSDIEKYDYDNKINIGRIVILKKEI